MYIYLHMCIYTNSLLPSCCYNSDRNIFFLGVWETAVSHIRTTGQVLVLVLTKNSCEYNIYNGEYA